MNYIVPQLFNIFLLVLIFLTIAHIAFISNKHDLISLELISIYGNDSSVFHPFNTNPPDRYLIRETNTINSQGSWDKRWGMANKYNYSYLKPQKIKANLEHTEKTQHYPHVSKHSCDFYVANLSLLSLLFAVLGSIGQWLANRSILRYSDIKFKNLFLKSNKPSKKQSKHFMLPKAILFFLIIISNDVESPNNNQHDREFQQHCQLFTNEYLKTAEKMKTNQLREQLSTYALSKLKFRENFAYFRFILLLSGDINLHPGPIKHPCTICSKAVKKRQISCIKCSLWTHKKCIQVSERAETYNNTLSFTCQPCLAKEILVSDNIWNNLPFSNCDHPFENPQNLLNNATYTLETNLESCLENDQWKTFNKHGLHLIHLNINSVLPKIDELREIAKKTRATVIGLIETKLDATILDGEVNIESYELIRSDRNRHGGGVTCYIKNDVAFRSRGGFSNEIENLFFDILLPKTKPILVGIVYRPPDQSRSLERLTSAITNTNDFNNQEVYILGDFNINLINSKKNVPNGIKKYHEFCSQHGLKQLITSPTRITMTTTSLLDHILIILVKEYHSLG